MSRKGEGEKSVAACLSLVPAALVLLVGLPAVTKPPERLYPPGSALIRNKAFLAALAEGKAPDQQERSIESLPFSGAHLFAQQRISERRVLRAFFTFNGVADRRRGDRYCFDKVEVDLSYAEKNPIVYGDEISGLVDLCLSFDPSREPSS